MLCENCGKRNATTHIRLVVNGTVREQNLCHECARAAGYGHTSTDPLDNLLSSLFGETASLSRETACPQCKTTFSQISATGKVGCPECYHTFYDRLAPYIQRVHGSTHHVGSQPTKATSTPTEKVTVESLRHKLQEMIAAENYEEAARLRDEIRAMEGGTAQ